VLLIDKMTLILPRITGISSGKTYLVITQPSNTKHLLLLGRLLSEITPLAGGPAGHRECCASEIIPSRKPRGVFPVFYFSAFPPQASEISSLW